jgi:hypothetical protein
LFLDVLPLALMHERRGVEIHASGGGVELRHKPGVILRCERSEPRRKTPATRAERDPKRGSPSYSFAFPASRFACSLIDFQSFLISVSFFLRLQPFSFRSTAIASVIRSK